VALPEVAASAHAPSLRSSAVRRRVIESTHDARPSGRSGSGWTDLPVRRLIERLTGWLATGRQSRHRRRHRRYI